MGSTSNPDVGADGDMEYCNNHFTIRGYVAKMRETNPRTGWPFSEESYALVEQNKYALPPLTVPKYCPICGEDIDDGTKDNAVEENSENGESSQKNDPQSLDASIVKSRSRKQASPQKFSNKRSKED